MGRSRVSLPARSAHACATLPVARRMRRIDGVIQAPIGGHVLLCDEDRAATTALSAELHRLGHRVTITRSCAEAFAAACAEDFDALLFAPFVRDGSALVLPSALGIRRPRLVVLLCRMTERLSRGVAAHFGIDAQATKIASVPRLDKLVRASMARAGAQGPRPAEAQPSDTSPPSGVSARFPH